MCRSLPHDSCTMTLHRSSALDERLEERVAIKKLQSWVHFAQRCCREIKLLRFLCHENVIGIMDMFTAEGTCVPVRLCGHVVMSCECIVLDVVDVVVVRGVPASHVYGRKGRAWRERCAVACDDHREISSQQPAAVAFTERVEFSYAYE